MNALIHCARHAQECKALYASGAIDVRRTALPGTPGWVRVERLADARRCQTNADISAIYALMYMLGWDGVS